MKVSKQFAEVHRLITAARERAFQAINAELIKLYWEVGRYIHEKVEAQLWGQGVVDSLAEFISLKEPTIKGFSARNLWRMRQFYETYHKHDVMSPLVQELSWTNNLIILARAKTDAEREFYLRNSIEKKLSKRDLERSISTSTYERIVLADAEMSRVQSPNSIKLHDHFKDTYFLDFLKLPVNFDEKNLRKSIILHLREFILELGGDFSFVAEEFRLQVGTQDFYVDLLFYHRGLQCLVAFELKVDQFRPEFLGKMSFYLEALDRHVKKPYENPSVGIILCKERDNEVVKYAMSRNMSPTLVAEYRTQLIGKKVFSSKMRQFLQHQVIPEDEN